MAISIDTIVDVDVSRQTTGITTNGYNLPMFLGLHKGFTERFKIYADMTEVGNDFAPTSNEYRAAQSHFSQTPSADRFAIGRQDSTTVTYTPVVANSANYSVTIDNVEYNFISDVDATADEIVTGLTSAINGDSNAVVTASGTSTLVLTADSPTVPFTAKASSNLTPVYATTETLTEAVQAILMESNEWYGGMGYSHIKADQLELAAAFSAARKTYLTSSSDPTAINSSYNADNTSAMKAFNTNNFDRAGIFYSAVADTNYPEASVMSMWFGYQPGQITVTNKRLAATPSDNLTGGQANNAFAKYGSVYAPVVADGAPNGTSIILGGTFGDGTFYDIIRDIDFAVSDLQVTVFNRFVNIPKIPFTAQGLALLEGAINDSMQRMITQGIFSRVEVIMPTLDQISANDRALRKVTGIKVIGTLAGAIHTCQINLTASVV